MDLDSYIWHSYYIKAGKETFYVKCLDTGEWIRCKSTFEVDDHQRIQKIHLDSSSMDLDEDKPIRVATRTVNPFGHPRTVIHQFELAEQFIRHLIRKFPTGWWKSTKTLIFQLDYSPEGSITDIELRAIRDSLEHCGAREIYILRPSATEHQADALYRQIAQHRFFRKAKLDPQWQPLVL